jgi:hypothetical protein
VNRPYIFTAEITEPFGDRMNRIEERDFRDRATDFHGNFFKRANAPDLRQQRFMNITKNLGMLLLAIYLILVGIIALFHVGIPVIVTGILALAAGILILIGR